MTGIFGRTISLLMLALLLCPTTAWAQASTEPAAKRSLASSVPVKNPKVYTLRPSDIVQVNVYQEEDMGAQARLEKDGTILLPLLGKVRIGGQTLEEASVTIRDLLAKDYLVNPQVSVAVVEHGKRRFTVLGQVQRPGSYEMPNDETLDLLQAIAMAGGYTRIGAPAKVTVQRRVNNETKTFKLNADAMSKDRNAQPFEVLQDDTITVGERLI